MIAVLRLLLLVMYAPLAHFAGTLHSPLLGGFFGRHFLYDSANPYPQAIALAKAVGQLLLTDRA